MELLAERAPQEQRKVGNPTLDPGFYRQEQRVRNEVEMSMGSRAVRVELTWLWSRLMELLWSISEQLPSKGRAKPWAKFRRNWRTGISTGYFPIYLLLFPIRFLENTFLSSLLLSPLFSLLLESLRSGFHPHRSPWLLPLSGSSVDSMLPSQTDILSSHLYSVLGVHPFQSILFSTRLQDALFSWWISYLTTCSFSILSQFFDLLLLIWPFDTGVIQGMVLGPLLSVIHSLDDLILAHDFTCHYICWWFPNLCLQHEPFSRTLLLVYLIAYLTVLLGCV